MFTQPTVSLMYVIANGTILKQPYNKSFSHQAEIKIDRQTYITCCKLEVPYPLYEDDMSS